MPQRWTSDDDAELTRRHGNGESLHSIAKAMGRAKATLSAKAAGLGLSWEREQVAKAARAHAVDAKARRAALQVALLEDAERLRTQLWEQATVFNFGGKDNTYAEHTLDKPPYADQLKIMQATGIAVDRSLKLADYDNTSSAPAAVDAWLEHMTGGIMGGQSGPPDAGTSERPTDSPS